MERQYKTLLGGILTTLLLLVTYLSNENEDEFYHIYDEHERSWPWSDPRRNLSVDPKSIALKPQDSQHTSGASKEVGIVPDKGTPRSKPPIQIFYNLFVNGPEDEDRVLGIFHEQLLHMDPVLHDVAFVNSVGYLPPEISERYVVGHHQEGGEDGALHALWDYCRANDNHETKVVYIHSKGSFHPKPANNILRRFLTEGALSEECASLPDRCNVCSSRMSSHPHPHTPGNMWLARCDYVARLRDPYDLKDGRLPAAFQGDSACQGYGRFFFEHWVHSHPSVQPCDLYPGSEFMSGYGPIPKLPFKKEIQMAPRFGFDAFAGKVNPRCRKGKYDMSTIDGYLETRREGYKQLYDIDVGGLNETWYLSQFVNRTSPL